MSKIFLIFLFTVLIFNLVNTYYLKGDNVLFKKNKKIFSNEDSISRSKEINLKNDSYKSKMNSQLVFDELLFRKKKAAVSNSERLWYRGIIPFLIDKELFDDDQLSTFMQAMLHWENYTCLKFVEKKPNDFDYIFFTELSCECCSDVGKKGNGKQIISLSKACSKFGNVVHELGHVIGFWHEHTRPDRDYNVDILYNNIVPGQEHNFKKLKNDEINSLGSPYDFNSIMHYSKNTFSKNYSIETIKPKNNVNVLMGQRVHLSEEDIKQANQLYHCSKGQTLINSEGFLNLNLNILNQNYYNKDFSYEWRIVASKSQRISITIKKFLVESYVYLNCESNYLIILNGYQNNSPILKKFCFNEVLITSLNLISETNRLLIIFKTEEKNVFNYLLFYANYEFICGGIIFQKKGYIETPNYPLNYPSNKTCLWVLKGNKNHSFILEFYRFDLEFEKNCSNDYLEIRKGYNETGQLINTLCGKKVPKVIQIDTDIILLKFVSDSKIEKNGFSLFFTNDFNECENNQNNCEHICVNVIDSFLCECYNGFVLSENNYSCEKTCGETINVEKSGSITSPNYPNDYPNNKNCKWNLLVASNFSLFLNFTYFNLESNNQFCYSDILSLRLKNSLDNNLFEVNKFCGDQLPEIDIEIKNFVQLEFKSDKSVTKKGFLLKYILDYDECSMNNGNCDQICINKLNSFECKCKKDYQFINNLCLKIPCIHVFKKPKGIIHSTDYLPFKYNNSSCVWKIETLPGHLIKIKFYFDNTLEHYCLKNSLAVDDGYTLPNSVSKSLNLFTNKTLTSKQNIVSILIKQSSKCLLKFKTKYKVVCGGYYKANKYKQIIYSHYNFGDFNYKSLTECKWTIRSENTEKIKISFLIFDLEFEKSCNFDYLKIYISEQANSSYIFCGDQLPKEIIFNTNILILEFVTDNFENSLGFKLAYEELE